MSFTAWEFPFLLVITVLLYWRLPLRGRVFLLLAASYFFYGYWDPRFLALILASTVVDYFCGQAIEGHRERTGKVLLLSSLPAAWLLIWMQVGAGDEGSAIPSWLLLTTLGLGGLFFVIYQLLWQSSQHTRRRAFLLTSIIVNLSLLGFFKYFGFFAESAEQILTGFGWQPGWLLLEVLLPVGISFYTFQSMAYSIDIYRGHINSVRDFPTFATYIAFFPQLVAGPIERPANLLPQLQETRRFHADDVHTGSRLILTGLFKKVFVADNCAILVNYAFDPSTPLNLQWAILGAIAFAFQIYGDFSGYTDIARGSARLFGIRLMRNFRFPYIARGPSDFWQRWHISLSSWFRDYLYIPLGGNRFSNLLTLRNLVITMLLAGLWHGAAWTFVVWGGYHGLLLVIYRVTPLLRNLEEGSTGLLWRQPLSIAVMFALTLIGWVIFRAPDFAYVVNWFAALGTTSVAGALDATKPFQWLLIHIIPLLLLQWWTRREQNEASLSGLPLKARVPIYLFMTLLVISSVQHDQEFIYFQF